MTVTISAMHLPHMNSMKTVIRKFLQKTRTGNRLLLYLNRATGRLPRPDMEFPQLISLELSSLCNLACVHCPPHNPEFKDRHRRYGHMDLALFTKLMDEIDAHGKRKIALHKDCEPLLNPSIKPILQRLKKNCEHEVYLTTNAHRLDASLCDEILNARINTVNFSIGAATAGFYRVVRGENFEKVINNIHTFLDARARSDWKPRALVQIINLPEYQHMKEEIRLFKEYWAAYDVEIDVWDKLNWGVFSNDNRLKSRYPCYSLWESLYVNSDGKVSPCCMDWTQELAIGNASVETLTEIWQGERLKALRKSHRDSTAGQNPMCSACNYRQWLPELDTYPG
jgi:radical SAM protein with 4Fe4S-binding SPASM domain